MSCIGIEVAKAHLEFAARPSGVHGTVGNEEQGIGEWVTRCHRDARGGAESAARRLREADADLHTAVKASPVWRVKDDLLQSVPGVGRVVSLTLRAELPEPRARRPRDCGPGRVAPLNRDSGTPHGTRLVLAAGLRCGRCSPWRPWSPATTIR
jgi:transposase